MTAMIVTLSLSRVGERKNVSQDHSYTLEPPEQLSLMQQLQQQVPKNMIFQKNSIQLGNTVGQGGVF